MPSHLPAVVDKLFVRVQPQVVVNPMQGSKLGVDSVAGMAALGADNNRQNRVTPLVCLRREKLTLVAKKQVEAAPTFGI